MGKTLIVGDMHLKQRIILPRVDAMVARYGIDRIVFVGDYCDERHSSDIMLTDALCLFADWAEDARAAGRQVDLLLGNHDYQYLLGEEGPGTHMEQVEEVRALLGELEPMVATTVEGFLITHAGLTESWVGEYVDEFADADEAAICLNELYRSGSAENLRILFERGPGRGGWDLPGPLWADRDELRSDAVVGINQIVGHTPVSTCELVCGGEGDAHDVQVWLCDTFSLAPQLFAIGDGSMLLVEDGQVSVVGGDDDEELFPWSYVVSEWESANVHW